MSGINRDLELDIRHISKHLPDTPQMQRLLQQEGSAHVFNTAETLQRVAQAIIDRGEFIGIIRNHERYGLYVRRSAIELTQTVANYHSTMVK